MPRVLDGRISDGQLAALRLAANGRTSAQIARQLGTTETGIHMRLVTAARSLGAHSRAHLVAVAMARGLITPADITHQPGPAAEESTRHDRPVQHCADPTPHPTHPNDLLHPGTRCPGTDHGTTGRTTP